MSKTTAALIALAVSIPVAGGFMLLGEFLGSRGKLDWLHPAALRAARTSGLLSEEPSLAGEPADDEEAA
jgi:hypothetical protein